MAENQKHYFEPLDGFRGLAVIFILFVHSPFEYFRIFWIGVPMFFVLSGFLITRLLLENKGAGNYFKAFYARRALRIFPIYYLTLLACVLWSVYSHADTSQLAVYVFYLQNFVISRDIPPEFCAGLLRHTWSLSVEEIFYLCWPLIVYILNTKVLARLSLLLALGTIVFKLAYTFFFYQADKEPFLMLSLVGNIDGLMIGSFLGILSLDKNSSITRAFPLRAFVIALILFGLLATLNYLPVFTAQYAYLIKLMLSPLTSLLSFFIIAWLIFFPEPQSLFHKTLTGKWIVWIGKLSYGIYIYHTIVYRLIDSFIYQNGLSTSLLLLFTAKLVLTLIVATLSWYCIELPFLRLKRKINFKAV